MNEGEEMQIKIKNEINNRLKNIKDLDSLLLINEFIKECEPINLKTYINIHFDDKSQDIKDAFEHEVREIWLKMQRYTVEPTSNYISHWSDIYVQGWQLDIFIAEEGALFSSYELADVIYRLWIKEIVF